jgi:hypothetical protein
MLGTADQPHANNASATKHQVEESFSTDDPLGPDGESCRTATRRKQAMVYALGTVIFKVGLFLVWFLTR